MLCPYCGAEVKNELICPLCGKKIDRESMYYNFLKKGDEYYSKEDYKKAIVNYEKAAEFINYKEEVYLKLANIYKTENQKKAIENLFKALRINFYNDFTHTLLISLYTQKNKLNSLKEWYEKSKQFFDEKFIEKYIDIINNSLYFSQQNITIKPEKKQKKRKSLLITSIKKYVFMNVFFSILTVFLTLSILIGYFLKINTTIIFIFVGVFFIVGTTSIFYYKTREIKKKNKTKKDFDEFFTDLLPK